MNIIRPPVITLATVALAVVGLTACSSNDSYMSPAPENSDGAIMSTTSP